MVLVGYSKNFCRNCSTSSINPISCGKKADFSENCMAIFEFSKVDFCRFIMLNNAILCLEF